jgi:hypothetical protein
VAPPAPITVVGPATPVTAQAPIQTADTATAPIKEDRNALPALEESNNSPAAAKPSNSPLSPATPKKMSILVTAQPATEKETTKETMPAPDPVLSNILSCHDEKKCRFMVFGDYLFWTVHGGDVPFAQAFDGIIPGLSVPRGAVGVVSPEFESGFRLGAGVSLCEGQWVTGTFTYFVTHRGSQIAAPDPFVLHNFLVFPNTATSAVDSLTSQADYRIRLYMADLDYHCAFVNNDHLMLNWVAGVRYAHLDQEVNNIFQITGTTTIDSRVNFDGIGPRIGLDGQCHLGCGFYGYTQGFFDLLLGQFRGNYVENNVFTGQVGQTSINANRVVPVLELELGVGWQSPKGRFRVSGGYYVGSWFNVMTTTSFASAIGNTNFTTNGNNFRDNLVFDGFVARFEFRY